MTAVLPKTRLFSENLFGKKQVSRISQPVNEPINESINLQVARTTCASRAHVVIAAA